jgi:hypothetical protein
MALFGPLTMSDLSPQCATKRTSINVIGLSVHPLASPPHDALARAGPVGEPCVARAIGQALKRRIAAKTEIRKPRSADRPAASLLIQLEQ